MEDPSDIPCPPHLAMPKSTVNQQVSSSFCSAQRSRRGLHIPNPQSQSFSPSFRSSLPTSLTYLNPVDQRLLTLEAWCSYGYDQGCEYYFSSAFQGQPGAHQKPQKQGCFPTMQPHLQAMRFQGRKWWTRKGNAPWGPLSVSPNSLMLPTSVHDPVMDF